MINPTQDTPRWIANLRSLMEAKGLNPRSLSLKAGLNATAVRDMLEGRTRFPRYDTVLALSKALEVSPAQLMGDKHDRSPSGKVTGSARQPLAHDDEDIELLTEIITRLQETAEEYKQQLKPRDFAAMVTAIYQRVRGTSDKKEDPDTGLQPKIQDLLAYETLRRRKGS